MVKEFLQRGTKGAGMIIASGEQHVVQFGDQRAVVVEVGGGIRSFTDRDRDVLQDYPPSVMCDGAHGTPLIPWPNRLADGRYGFDGVVHQLPLTEPDKHNAIHGLLRWRSWRPVDQTREAIVMGIRLHPEPGYPFGLDVQVSYRLDAAGLTVRTTATNVGEVDCPFACGQHPYLSPGDGLIDLCRLEVPARTRIVTDATRQLPVGKKPVEGTAFNWRWPRPLESVRLDDPFTDLSRDEEGRAWVRLHRPDGSTVELWVDRAYPIVELFTGDTLTASRRRRGLGVEPMSAPPNSFQSGELVQRLRPGQSWTGEWGVRMVDRSS